MVAMAAICTHPTTLRRIVAARRTGRRSCDYTPAGAAAGQQRGTRVAAVVLRAEHGDGATEKRPRLREAAGRRGDNAAVAAASAVGWTTGWLFTGFAAMAADTVPYTPSPMDESESFAQLVVFGVRVRVGRHGRHGGLFRGRATADRGGARHEGSRPGGGNARSADVNSGGATGGGGGGGARGC
eukprot:8718271-Pyramimonas_sp.AAC.1